MAIMVLHIRLQLWDDWMRLASGQMELLRERESLFKCENGTQRHGNLMVAGQWVGGRPSLVVGGWKAFVGSGWHRPQTVLPSQMAWGRGQWVSGRPSLVAGGLIPRPFSPS